MNDLYRPSVAQQIEAVLLAKVHVRETMKRLRRRPSEIEEVARKLQAAAETLKTLEFARETLS